jgi:hypothetical protein
MDLFPHMSVSVLELHTRRELAPAREIAPQLNLAGARTSAETFSPLL